MGDKSLYLGQQVAQHVFDISGYVAPATVYVGLTLSNGTEVSGGGYDRIAVATGSDEWEWNSEEDRVENINSITFAQATAGWGEITGALIADSSAGSNLLYHSADALVTPRTINSDDQLVIEANGLRIQET